MKVITFSDLLSFWVKFSDSMQSIYSFMMLDIGYQVSTVLDGVPILSTIMDLVALLFNGVTFFDILFYSFAFVLTYSFLKWLAGII